MIITSHVLKRWITHILNPDQYKHLRRCKRDGCPNCIELKTALNEMMFGRYKPYIEKAIHSEFGKTDLITSGPLYDFIMKDDSHKNHLIFKGNRVVFLVKRQGEEFILRGVDRLDSSRFKKVVFDV